MSTICQFIVAQWVTGHIVESNNCLACTGTFSRGVCLVFLKECVFTLTIKWVSSDMLPPGTFAYFVLNLELTHLSLTTHTLCIFFFPTACIVCVQHQNRKTEPPTQLLSCHFVLILLVFFLCLIGKFRWVIRKKMLTLGGVKQRDGLHRDCTVSTLGGFQRLTR